VSFPGKCHSFPGKDTMVPGIIPHSPEATTSGDIHGRGGPVSTHSNPQAAVDELESRGLGVSTSETPIHDALLAEYRSAGKLLDWPAPGVDLSGVQTPQDFSDSLEALKRVLFGLGGGRHSAPNARPSEAPTKRPSGLPRRVPGRCLRAASEGEPFAWWSAQTPCGVGH